jgi:hypothetical protein
MNGSTPNRFTLCSREKLISQSSAGLPPATAVAWIEHGSLHRETAQVSDRPVEAPSPHQSVMVQPISVQAHAHPRPRYPQKRRKCSGDLEGIRRQRSLDAARVEMSQQLWKRRMNGQLARRRRTRSA